MKSRNKTAIRWRAFLTVCTVLFASQQLATQTIDTPARLLARQVEGLPSDRASVATLDHPAIRYAHEPTTDAIQELNRLIDSGRVALDFNEANGYLGATLKALDVA